MKKKNLLALSALVLSLGLTVSSCAGAQGEKGDTGDKGDTGETGPQGPQGEAGQDGKTYVDVIVLNSVTNDGKITQDKWAVEEGKNETVTFTFTPKDETVDLIVDFQINGEVVADVIQPNEDGTLTFTFTVDDSYKSVQVTNASFTSVKAYAGLRMREFYETLTDGDSQLIKLDETGVADSTQVKGQWADESNSVVTELNKQISSLTKAVDDLGKDATSAEKVAKVNELLPAAQEAVTKAYNDALTLIKEKATKALEELSDSVKSTNYKDEDKEAVLTNGKTAISEATTIAQVTNVINNVSVTGKLETGTYNQLLNRKVEAFGKVETALTSVYKLEPSLKDSESDEYKELVNALAAWDVSVDQLPATVAQSYLDQISAAKTLEEIPTYDADSATGATVSYKKGEVILGVEGANAVTNSLQGLKNQLVANIRTSYEAEIDNSKVITATSSRESLKGIVNNVVDTWLSTTGNKEKGLVEYATDIPAAIETKLSDKGNANYNSAFQAERVQNALAEAKTTLSALAKAEVDSDADYAKAIDFSQVSATATSHANEWLVKNPKIGSTGYQVANPFVGATTQDTTNKKYYATSLVTGTNVGGVSGNTTYSVNEWLSDLFPATGYGVGLSATSSVSDIRTWATTHSTDFEKIHDAAKEVYLTAQETAAELVLDATDGDDAILADAWNGMFHEADSEYTMSDVSSARVGIEGSKALLFTEGTGLVRNVESFLNGVAATDPNYASHVYEPEISELREAYEALIEDVVAGSADQNDIDSFVDTLPTLYAADVTSYKEQAVKDLQDAVNAIKLQNPADVTNNRLMDQRLTSAISVLGSDATTGLVYDDSTVTSIDSWLSYAVTFVIGKENVDTTDKEALFEALVNDYKAVTFPSGTPEINGVFARLDDVWAPSSYQESIIINVSTLDVIAEYNHLIEDLGLLGKVTSSSDENGAAEVFYDLTTVNGVYTWYHDALAVKNYVIGKSREITDLAKEYRKVLTDKLDSLVGTEVKDTDQATFGTQVNTKIKAVFEKYGTIPSANENTTFVNFTFEEGKVKSWAINTNAGTEVFKLGYFTNFRFDNDATDGDALIHVFTVLASAGADKYTAYDLTTESGVANLLSAITAEINAIDGKAA